MNGEQRPLKIALLNAGWGDSLVLELPNGDWGVIDCNCRSGNHDHNPTVCYLRQRNVHRLAFVCLTHPHSDHFSGLSHLFDEFEVREFWYFHLGRNGNLRRLFRYIDYEAERLRQNWPTDQERHGGRHFENLLNCLDRAKIRDESF